MLRRGFVTTPGFYLYTRIWRKRLRKEKEGKVYAKHHKKGNTVIASFNNRMSLISDVWKRFVESMNKLC